LRVFVSRISPPLTAAEETTKTRRDSIPGYKMFKLSLDVYLFYVKWKRLKECKTVFKNMGDAFISETKHIESDKPCI